MVPYYAKGAVKAIVALENNSLLATKRSAIVYMLGDHGKDTLKFYEGPLSQYECRTRKQRYSHPSGSPAPMRASIAQKMVE